jgi:hypothetical protein
MPTHMRIVWHRGKANINRLLDNTPPTHESTPHLPYEIVEMIIVHIAHDLNALKAFSLTCRSWYTAAAPNLYHTLTLTSRVELKPLSNLHQLGLMPFVKEIRVVQYSHTWLVPQAFSHGDLYYFSAFANVQTLTFEGTGNPCFMPGVERHFQHLSPTLRSIAFYGSFCAPRQLPHFLSLFPNLDDITIWRVLVPPPNAITSDTEAVPFSTPRLGGRLVIRDFNFVETWAPLIASCGGLRFRHMDLCRVKGCAPILFEACAETLETLRLHATDGQNGEWLGMSLATDES